MRKYPTIAEIMKEHITKQKRVCTTKQLTDLVKKKRPDLKSKDLSATIRSVLQKKVSFKRIGPGIYDIND